MLILTLSLYQWWRDVRREATLQGKHTLKVETGIRGGIFLFIVSELIFFFSFFWTFFHSSLHPSPELGRWPPQGIDAIQPFGVPLLNTTILVTSGATITWSHHALLHDIWGESRAGIGCTVGLGLLFASLQALEYTYRPFSISDSVYGSVFFVATGFHGLHVIIGSIFIIVIWCRHYSGHFSSKHNFGFEASAWYWHFVDVVWLFLFLRIYWWGY